MRNDLNASRGILRAVAMGAVLWVAICAYARADSQALTNFPELNTAARAALAEAESFAPGFEAGGTLYQCGESYAYVAPVTQHKKEGLEVDTYAAAGCVLVAFYHTHPKGDARFSGVDIAGACAAHVLSFIKPAGGEVRVFDCSHLPTSLREAAISGQNWQLSRGHAI